MKLDYSEVRSISSDDLATGWDRAVLMIYALVHQGRSALPENPELALMMVLDLLRVFFLPIQYLCSLRLPMTDKPLLLTISGTANHAFEVGRIQRLERTIEGDVSHMLGDPNLLPTYLFETYKSNDDVLKDLLSEDTESNGKARAFMLRVHASLVDAKDNPNSQPLSESDKHLKHFMGFMSPTMLAGICMKAMLKDTPDASSHYDKNVYVNSVDRHKTNIEQWACSAISACGRHQSEDDVALGFYHKAHELVGKASNGTIKEVAAKVIQQFGLTKETTATRVLTILRSDFQINDTLAYFMQHYDEFDEDDARDAYMEVYYTVRDALEAEIVAQLGIEPGVEGYDEEDDYGHDGHMKGGREFIGHADEIPEGYGDEGSEGEDDDE